MGRTSGYNMLEGRALGEDAEPIIGAVKVRR